MKSPILGSSYVARSVNAADNRMINLYPEAVPEGGLEPAFLNRAPGLRKVMTIGAGPIRAMWTHQTRGTDAYIVSGNEVYKIYDGFSRSVLLGKLTSNSGPVSIADNGTQLFFACNPDGFIYNESTDTFKQITDPDFPGAVTVGYLDGYFIFNEPKSQKIWSTELLDGTSIDPQSFASAEGSPDGVVSVVVNQREAWVFGTDTVEVWYDAGLSPFPLTRIQGAFNELGCAAPYSIAKLDNTLFWLGTDARGFGMVYRAQGYVGKRVSTHAVEFAIQSYPNVSDAIAYSYQQEGHSFYVLTFPSANKTWVLDVATNAWHERAGFINGEFVRHRSNCQMNYNQNIVVGDYENGNIYVFDLDVYKDDTQPQKWLRSWRALPTGQNNLKRTAHHSLQLEAETGVGLVGNTQLPDYSYLTPLIIGAEQEHIIVDFNIVVESVAEAANPQVMLRWSDDGGHTWSNEHWKSLGLIGGHSNRTIWRRLGMTTKLRDRVYEVSGTDAVKVSVMGAELIVSGTNA